MNSLNKKSSSGELKYTLTFFALQLVYNFAFVSHFKAWTVGLLEYPYFFGLLFPL